MTDYSQLKRAVRQAGLLEPQPVYYAGRIVLALTLLAAGLLFLAAVKDLRLQLLNAVYMAFVFGQISFLIHDAGHRQIFAASWKNDLLGLLGADLLLGVSFGSWRQHHSRHHRHPNQLGLDPDLAIEVLAFTEEQAEQKRGISRRIVKHQAFWFPLLVLLEGLSKRGGAVRFLLSTKSRHRGAEALLLAAHYVWFLGLLFYCLGVGPALLFIAVQQGLFGLYMVSVFAPNHKGMPILAADSGLDFLRQQVITARNIRAHPFTDFLYGGTNYQIEHHLFPRMARNKLGAAQQIVEPFCRVRDVRYHQTGIGRSFRELLGHMHEVGRPLRASG